MKIKMRAPEGVTHANIEGSVYEADEEGHIYVNNPGHVPVLKRHGWAEPTADDHAREDFLYGSSRLPAILQLGGRETQLGTVVAHAHARSGLSARQWNDLHDQVRERLLELSCREIDEAPVGETEPAFDAMTKRELVAWLKERGVEKDESLTKPALVAAARSTHSASVAPKLPLES